MCNRTTALVSNLHADLSRHIDVQLPSWAPDSTVTEVACFLLRNSLLKKFNEEDEPSAPACKSALEKFLAVNKRCGEWVIPYETSLDEVLVGGVKDALYRFWFKGNGGPEPTISSYNQLFEHGMVGPGASVKARDTDLYTKLFDSPLSSTEGLRLPWSKVINGQGLASIAMSGSALLLRAELERHRLHGFAIVDSNSLSFVNKTVTIARCIATEPTINMWFQLGAASLLRKQMIAQWGLDMSNQQDVNRELACIGSRSGRFSTIDLESASDSLGVGTMKQILPRSMFDWLMSLRSPYSKLPNQEKVALNMISTQGNGYNSALQTIVFTAVIQSVYHSLGLPMKGRGRSSDRNFGVFGDDMIVDVRAHARVLRTLYLLGFVVNTDKTFVEGQFRESCGADYFDGVNVRGVYIQDLRTPQYLFAAINALNRWSARHNIGLANTVGLLLSWLRKLKRNPIHCFVPRDEDDAAGIKVLAVHANAHTLRSTSVFGQMTYSADVPTQWNFIIAGKHIWTYREQVRRNFNPEGLEVAFIAGSIRGYKVTLRQRETKYTTKRRFTPVWDKRPEPRPWEDLASSYDRRFVDACDRNLVSCGFWEWSAV